MTFNPVIRRATTIFFHIFMRRSSSTIQRHTIPKDFFYPMNLWTMRVFRCLYPGMMFAMHSNPLLGNHTGGKPVPETKNMRDRPVQIEAAMSLTTM